MAPTRSYKCTVCSKEYPHPSHLMRHMDVHNTVKDFECDVCHKFFTRADGVKRHQLRKHATVIQMPPDNDDTDERPYVCASCGRGFRHHRNLCDHQKIHEPKKKFQCPRCYKFWTRERCLRTHMPNCSGLHNSGSSGTDSSPDDDLGDGKTEDSIAPSGPTTEEAGANNDAELDHDFDMLDDSDALASDFGDKLCQHDITATPAPITDEESVSADGASSAVDENVYHYRTPDGFDEDEDDASPAVEYIVVPLARVSASRDGRPSMDLAAFIGLENFLRRMSLHYVERLPAEALTEVFAFLPRADLTKSSLVCRRYRNFASTFDTLHHIANLVVEPVARGLRPFAPVPNALAFVAERGLLRMAYVENLAFRQTGLGEVPNFVWQQLATTMTTTRVGQWTIDGLRLEAIARFGKIRAPFDAVRSLQSLSIRNCPYLRTRTSV